MTKNELNSSQISAIEYINGPLIIVAGAGTGKTTVITNKIRYLIDNKLAKPDEILALTFNEKAAAEMQKRVDEMLPIGYLDMYISTFHAFSERLLEQYGLDIGLPNRFKILTQTDAWLLIRKHLSEFNLDYYRPLGNPTRYIHELIKHFSKCKDELISPEDYLAYAEGLKLDNDDIEIGEKNRVNEISNAYHIYNRLLLNNNALDFGDLIYYANYLMDKRPAILGRLQKKFKYILVDEFQDVNWAQYQLVKKIASKNTQLTVVGDDDQSIYAFRGASISNILRFKDDFPEAKEIVLNKNYRSNQKILDKAYQLIQNNNPDRLEIKLQINKKLVAIKKDGDSENVIYSHFKEAAEEANFVVNEIARIKESDKDAIWDDFAVLVRANNHADPFINAFEKAGMPYEFLAAAGLFKQPIVLDCINFFKAITNYHESPCIYRLLRMPIFEFDEDDMQKLVYFAAKKSISYYEALKRAAEIKFSGQGAAVVERLVGLIREGMAFSRSEKPTTVLYKFFETSGYLQYLTKGESRQDRSIVRQIYHLKQFFEYISNYESITPGSSVSDFIDHFGQVVDSGDLGVVKQPEDTPDSINILTVHTAKGLEFKYVFIVNLTEERFPVRKKGEPIELPDQLIKEILPAGDSHYAEERRLFYVAMTRAKERLFLTHADDYGGVREKKTSRFLLETGYTLNIIEKKLSDKFDMPKRHINEGLNNGLLYEIPSAFSFSQIQKYEKCPYQYKLSSILGLPTPSRGTFSFGSTMHNTLEKFYARIKELNGSKQNSFFNEFNTKSQTGETKVPPLAELFNIYEQSWIPDWYENREQRESYYEKGKNILKEFYKTNNNSWTLPISLETGFSVKFGSNVIRGRIDRIDLLADGGLEIIDYKTGTSKDKIAGDDKDQLLIYQIAVSQLENFKNIGQAKLLTYYYLDDNKRVSFLGTEKDMEKIKEKINCLISEILKQNFRPTPEKFTCAHCDFRDICEFRS